MATRDWIISDSIKLCVCAVLLVLALLQMFKSGHNIFLRKICHATNVMAGVTICVWLINMNGLLGYGWIAELVLGELNIFILLQEGILISYWVTKAGYESTNLSNRLPERFGLIFIAISAMYTICDIIGVTLTAVYDNYRYSIIRHLAGALVLFVVSTFTGWLLFKLRSILLDAIRCAGRLSQGDGDGFLFDEFHNNRHIKTLTKSLIFLLVIALVSLFSSINFTFETMRDEKEYSKLVRETNSKYTVVKDFTAFWSILMGYAFMIYYNWMPLDTEFTVGFSRRLPQQPYNNEDFKEGMFDTAAEYILTPS
mmetsp:Transcript_1323/g.3084  ORF Transcript_1323/g.3084 Transcript_1323/m.3084 type:complete len:311 (-) Transcript_1323:353-1285(-)